MGNAPQVQLSYDCSGDGSWNRGETYRYFATDPVAGWEHYTERAALISATGAACVLKRNRPGKGVERHRQRTQHLGTGDLSEIHLSYE
ncbi:hypothetical protein [Streptomyces sp. NBC_00645]|uniref:hypothetical protein n=1 Tax=Streptomyces sp. NBC_00645 TaxID=2975795 RepID=UPI003246B7D6